MFLHKLFSRDYQTLKSKGDNLFAAERFADAKVFYAESLDKLNATSENQAERDYLLSRLSSAGNRLAELNIVEAEAALNSRDYDKGREHLKLSLELADDVTIREKAESMLNSDLFKEKITLPADSMKKGHDCSSCSPIASDPDPEVPAFSLENLGQEEQFQLLIDTLPTPLPQRYEALGKKFACAYLFAHSDRLDEALKAFIELLADGENDILLYECALVKYRQGFRNECEALLNRAIELNGDNPLCYLSMAQLHVDMKRLQEAVSLLHLMLDRRILPEQSLIMLGDVYMLQGDVENGISTFTKALQVPMLRKVAAQRLVPRLVEQNRSNEAAFIVKTYLGGCC
jgi:tetratricopeptide (TPR) repeat protein